MSGSRKFPLAVVLVACAFLVTPSWQRAAAYEWNEANSCVLLNSGNTDILSRPEQCDLLPENFIWCNCSRTVLTNTVRGEPAGIELGVMWIVGQNGIGNHRVEINRGTLDLSAISVGDVIGGSLTRELVPEAVGVPPGTFFQITSKVVVTGRAANTLDFEMRIDPVDFVAFGILGYFPEDADHSNGVLYQGQITSHGPGNGFTLEYRYAHDPRPGKHAAIEPSDAGSPGFTARFAIAFLTEGAAASAYTLPAGENELQAITTLRMFRDGQADSVTNPDEILPLGMDDLCQVIEEPEPCKEFEDFIPLTGPVGNRRPEASIVATNPFTLEPLVDPPFVSIDCGEGRVILRGSNSTDGDNGTQGLSFQWEIVAGPDMGARIPPETINFQDTEVSIFLPGNYTFRLTVNDGQAMDNLDTEEVTIAAEPGFFPDNLPPEVTSFTANDVELFQPPDVVEDVEIQLAGQEVVLRLDVDDSTGADGCQQELQRAWTLVSGPAEVTFSDPTDDDTDVTFTAPGEYVIRITLDDGAPANNLTILEVTVTVRGALETFLRCDATGDGKNNIADPIFTLGHLFLGGPAADCAASMDCSGDGKLDISDPIADLSFLFQGGQAPPEPYPNCDQAEKEKCAASSSCPPGP